MSDSMDSGYGETEPLFSERQVRLLSRLSLWTAPLSAVGSFVIIHQLYKDRKRQQSPVYSRLLTGLSAFDIIHSCRFVFLGPWMVPEGTDFVVGARGTIATCDASGFISILGIGTSFYTVFITVYFALQLRFGLQEATIAALVEPWFHGIAVAAPCLIATYALAMEYLNPLRNLPGQCWIHDYPSGCSSDEDVACIRGEDYELFGNIVGPGLIIFAWFVMSICLLLIFFQLSATERRLRAYSRESDARLVRAHQVFSKALAFFAAHMLCYAAWLALQLTTVDETTEFRSIYFTLSLYTALLNPMQGAFNSYIFLNTKYTTLLPEDARAILQETALSTAFSPSCASLEDDPSELVARSEGVGVPRDNGDGTSRSAQQIAIIDLVAADEFVGSDISDLCGSKAELEVCTGDHERKG